MEGVVMSRYGVIGLDSLLTFDDRGFAYDWILDPAPHSAPMVRIK